MVDKPMSNMSSAESAKILEKIEKLFAESQFLRQRIELDHDWREERYKQSQEFAQHKRDVETVMTTVAKTVPKLWTLQRAVREFRRTARLPICAALVYGLLACPSVLPAADRGTISGTVVDELSHPVPHTKVFADITGIPIAMLVPWAETDANGRFAIRHLRWGTYVVVADRPDAPYGQVGRFRNFYGRRWIPWVTVSPQAPVATVALQLVPKLASLSGRVVSARTGQPIVQAVLEIRRPGRVGARVGRVVQAQFTLAIPSEMVIALTVRAPGFDPWRSTVRMNPGERKDLTIRLRPLAPKPRAP